MKKNQRDQGTEKLQLVRTRLRDLRVHSAIKTGTWDPKTCWASLIGSHTVTNPK